MIQILNWHRTDANLLSEPMMAQFTDACILVSPDLNVINGNIYTYIYIYIYITSPNTRLFNCDYSRAQQRDPKCFHEVVIKWKHFPRYWPFARGIHQWPMNSLHKGLVTRKMFPFDDVIVEMRNYDVYILLVWTSCLTNSRRVGNFWRHVSHRTSL